LLDKVLGHQTRDLSLLLLAGFSNDMREAQMPPRDECPSVAKRDFVMMTYFLVD
jgi:hypothetical protein